MVSPLKSSLSSCTLFFYFPKYSETLKISLPYQPSRNFFIKSHFPTLCQLKLSFLERRSSSYLSGEVPLWRDQQSQRVERELERRCCSSSSLGYSFKSFFLQFCVEYLRMRLYLVTILALASIKEVVLLDHDLDSPKQQSSIRHKRDRVSAAFCTIDGIFCIPGNYSK